MPEISSGKLKNDANIITRNATNPIQIKTIVNFFIGEVIKDVSTILINNKKVHNPRKG